MPFVFRDGSVAGVCSVCGEPGWSIRSNKCAEHRTTPPVKLKAEKAKKGKGSSVNPDGSSKSTAAQFVAAAGAIDAKTFSGKPPTAAEWEDKLTALVVLATMTYVEYVVVKPFRLPEPDATNAVALLGMTDDEARTIVEPCSYLLSKSSINKKHGREALELLAFAPAILAIVAWADRVQSFRHQMLDAQQGVQLGEPYVRAQGPEASPGASQTPGGAPLANFTGITDPGQAPTARVNGDRSHVDV
jgi:hypothetical protein